MFWTLPSTPFFSPPTIKGRTIRKLIGGQVGAKYKKILAQGKIKWKKNHARQLLLKNIHALAKKNSYKEFDNEKNSCGSKISLPPP